MRAQMATAFNIATKTGNVAASREYADALCFAPTALPGVTVEPVSGPVKGHWYTPRAGARNLTLLYLHGGGYTYYAKTHANFIALMALTADARTFALDYRLAPEHPFPAQLTDALGAYRWLLGQGVDPRRLVVAGDSAGGNLTLALLQTVRGAGLPQPALAYCICPWTDLENSGASLTGNDDWIQARMAAAWAKYVCAGGANPRDPLVSPLHANLRNLAPIYIQAGGAEILLDMIRDFYVRAQAQGAEVTLDIWDHMPHDFQGYGDLVPEAHQALQRFREKLAERLEKSDGEPA